MLIHVYIFLFLNDFLPTSGFYQICWYVDLKRDWTHLKQNIKMKKKKKKRYWQKKKEANLFVAIKFRWVVRKAIEAEVFLFHRRHSFISLWSVRGFPLFIWFFSGSGKRRITIADENEAAFYLVSGARWIHNKCNLPPNLGWLK